MKKGGKAVDCVFLLETIGFICGIIYKKKQKQKKKTLAQSKFPYEI